MAARPGARVVRWLAALLRLEDVLLLFVAFAGAPILDRLTGSGVDATGGATAGEPSALTGAFGLLAIVGVLACLCTRGPGESAAFADSQLTFQGWARFPLMAGVGIVALETVPGLGIDPGPFVGLTFLVVLVTAVIGGVLPVVPIAVRRALVTPMALVATGAFNQMVGGGLGGTVVAGLLGSGSPEVRAFLPLIVAAVATLYVMLVVAPRAIADPGASGLAWTVRFLLLLFSLVAGDALAGVLG